MSIHDGSIKMIEISDIHISNPRVRNQRTHRSIVRSIETIGIKRPISVRPASSSDDPRPYVLICGQGRLEACQQLGHKSVPALVLNVDEKTGHVMGIIENVARRTPRAAEIMDRVQDLRCSGYSDRDIATKLGCTASWVNIVGNLLERGERRLLSAVEAGHMSMNLAIEISRSEDQDVQQLLIDAYEAGDLKGRKISIVRRLLDRRSHSGKSGTSTFSRQANRRKMTPEDLSNLYKRDAEMHRKIQKKAEFVERSLLLCREIMRDLFRDEDFLALMREQDLRTIPQPLADLLPAGKAR